MAVWLRLATASCVLGAGILFAHALPRGEAVRLPRALDELPLLIGPHRAVEEGLEPEVITKLGVTEFVMRRYSAPDRLPIWLYVGYYESQRTGAIIHSPRQCLPGSGWNIVKLERVSLDSLRPASAAATINRVLVAKGADRQVVLYWYQERGRIIASEYSAKAYMIRDSLLRNRTDGALVRLSAPVLVSEEETYRQLVDFSRRIFPSLAELLPS